MWRYGYPKSLDWDGNVGSWTESEGFSSSEQCEHKVGSFALCVVGQEQSGEKISLFSEDWELARVALSCHIALDIVGILLFSKFRRSVNTVSLFGMSDFRRFKRVLCIVYTVQKVERRLGPPFGCSGVHLFFKPQTHEHWTPRRLRLES